MNSVNESKIRKRGFEKVSLESYLKSNSNASVENYQTIKMPLRKTFQSAGYDFFAPYSFVLLPGDSILLPTGIKAYMQETEFLAIYIRSSLGAKKDIVMKNSVGIIDSDYYNNSGNEGHIFLALKNTSNTLWSVSAGDAVAQGIFQKYLTVDDEEKELQQNRLGGFGSTGK